MMLITEYDLKPPLDLNLNFEIQQLNYKETAHNFIMLAKNSFDLNDNRLGIDSLGGTVFGDSQEGEFYAVKTI
jgi:hypothetical protein